MLRQFFKIILTIICALVLFSGLTKISPESAMVLNVFNLVVLYFAMEKGEVTGAIMGSAVGLIQDSFSIAVFGIAGISKTIMGFLAGYISKRINIAPFFRRLIFIFIMLLLEGLIWMALYSFVIAERFYTSRGWLFLQPVSTTALAFIVFPIFDKLNKILSKR